MVWPPMKENRLQRMRVRKGPDPHLRSHLSPWKPFTRQIWTVLRAEMRYLQSRVPVLNPPFSPCVTFWSICWCQILLIVWTLCAGIYIQRTLLESFFPPLLSYLTNFLFGILLNLERAFEALMFKFWQPVVCSSDSQTVSLCDISVVKAGIKRRRSGTHCSNNHPIVSPSQNQLACQTHSHLRVSANTGTLENLSRPSVGCLSCVCCF